MRVNSINLAMLNQTTNFTAKKGKKRYTKFPVIDDEKLKDSAEIFAAEKKEVGFDKIPGKKARSTIDWETDLPERFKLPVEIAEKLNSIPNAEILAIINPEKTGATALSARTKEGAIILSKTVQDYTTLLRNLERRTKKLKGYKPVKSWFK